MNPSLSKKLLKSIQQPKALTKAQDLARSGDIDSALPVIERCYKDGDQPSCVTLAEIYAFQGRWSEAFEMASQYLLHVDPHSYRAPMNVYSECVQLMAACCMEIQELKNQVPSIAEMAETVAMRAIQNDSNETDLLLGRGDFPNCSDEQWAVMRNQATMYVFNSYKTKLDQLRTFVAGGDFDSVFYGIPSTLRSPELIPAADVPMKPEQLMDLFSRNRGDSRILIDLKNRFGYGPWLSEELLSLIAKTYIADNDAQQAWEAIEALASNWQPIMTFLTVLPSVLVTDPKIRDFLKGERMLQIIALPKCRRWQL